MLKQTKKSVSFSDYVEYKEYNLTWQERYEKYHHYSKTIIKSLKNSKKKYKKKRNKKRRNLLDNEQLNIKKIKF